MKLTEIGMKACKAKTTLGKISNEQIKRGLLAAAEELRSQETNILDGNKKDFTLGKENGMSIGLLDRLTLTPERIADMADGLKQIANLEDCIGEIMDINIRPNGLVIEKRRVPLGVIGIIYESRPNVTADAFALCFKTGNAVILKGGSDALNSNIAITKAIRDALESCGLPADAIILITDTDRNITKEFMQMKEYVDVLIPRGGAGLIRAVVENSTIPVIETGTGNCHIYVDEQYDLDMALSIIENAKTQRIGVCNACESLVLHNKILSELLPKLDQVLTAKGVEIRGDEEVQKWIPSSAIATEEDYGTEYLDNIISIKIVNNIEEAIAHINRYHTKHSDSIITSNQDAAERFLNEIDSACVYVNASTRFTDGFEFGFGGEIGISTQVLHARGPMGLKELTTYKYTIRGDGQIR